MGFGRSTRFSNITWTDALLPTSCVASICSEKTDQIEGHSTPLRLRGDASLSHKHDPDAGSFLWLFCYSIANQGVERNLISAHKLTYDCAATRLHDPLEKNDVIETGFSYDQIEVLPGQLRKIRSATSYMSGRFCLRDLARSRTMDCLQPILH
jgi:hypothetical protein